MLDALPPTTLHQEQVICALSAGVKYDVPVNVMLAVAEQEGGKPHQWVKNTNGTYDVGQLQFNTRYLAELGQYGIKPQDVAAAGCYAFDLAAWRIRGHLDTDRGDLWQRIANYHSRTSQHNETYQRAIKRRAEKWANWLEGRFSTRRVR